MVVYAWQTFDTSIERKPCACSKFARKTISKRKGRRNTQLKRQTRGKIEKMCSPDQNHVNTKAFRFLILTTMLVSAAAEV